MAAKERMDAIASANRINLHATGSTARDRRRQKQDMMAREAMPQPQGIKKRPAVSLEELAPSTSWITAPLDTLEPESIDLSVMLEKLSFIP